jgi:hypothetical protein
VGSVVASFKDFGRGGHVGIWIKIFLNPASKFPYPLFGPNISVSINISESVLRNFAE